MREGFELVFVAVFTRVTADVILRLVFAELNLGRLSKLSRAIGAEQSNRTEDQSKNQECFDECTQTSASSNSVL